MSAFVMAPMTPRHTPCGPASTRAGFHTAAINPRRDLSVDMNQPTAIITGLAVGMLARWLLLKKAPGGLPLALLLGMAGAMFTAFLMQVFDVARDAAAPQFLLAIAGSSLLLLGYRLDLAREAALPAPTSRDLKAQAPQ